MNNKKNTQYAIYDPQQNNKTTTIKRKQKNTNYSSNSTVKNKIEIQTDLHTIGIYDHEWSALKKLTNKIKTGCSKTNLGNIIDGFGAGIVIPFCLDLYKLISAETIPNELRSETKFYFCCFVFFLVLEGIKIIFKPKCLTGYSTLYSDIETLDDRLNEIDNRIGLTKKE